MPSDLDADTVYATLLQRAYVTSADDIARAVGRGQHYGSIFVGPDGQILAVGRHAHGALAQYIYATANEGPGSVERSVNRLVADARLIYGQVRNMADRGQDVRTTNQAVLVLTIDRPPTAAQIEALRAAERRLPGGVAWTYIPDARSVYFAEPGPRGEWRGRGMDSLVAAINELDIGPP